MKVKKTLRKIEGEKIKKDLFNAYLSYSLVQ